MRVKVTTEALAVWRPFTDKRSGEGLELMLVPMGYDQISQALELRSQNRFSDFAKYVFKSSIREWRGVEDETGKRMSFNMVNLNRCFGQYLDLAGKVLDAIIEMNGMAEEEDEILTAVANRWPDLDPDTRRRIGEIVGYNKAVEEAEQAPFAEPPAEQPETSLTSDGSPG